MKYYRDRYQVNNKVKTFHIVHSFSNKEELTPEQAHEISLEWFKKMFPNTAIAIAATHTDTNTLHTHFLVNNVTLDGIKIRTDKEWIKRSIEISNEICKAHGLKYSIIENKKMIPNKSWLLTVMVYKKQPHLRLLRTSNMIFLFLKLHQPKEV